MQVSIVILKFSVYFGIRPVCVPDFILILLCFSEIFYIT